MTAGESRHVTAHFDEWSLKKKEEINLHKIPHSKNVYQSSGKITFNRALISHWKSSSAFEAPHSKKKCPPSDQRKIRGWRSARNLRKLWLHFAGFNGTYETRTLEIKKKKKSSRCAAAKEGSHEKAESPLDGPRDERAILPGTWVQSRELRT